MFYNTFFKEKGGRGEKKGEKGNVVSSLRACEAIQMHIRFLDCFVSSQ